MNIKVIKTKIDGVLIFQPEKFLDSRVLRGLHFQKKPYEQAKLVRVIKGEIQDIAVDIRPKSKTYKQYVSVNLNEENKKQLYVPKGFAHGFLVLSNEAIVHYKMDEFYIHESNGGIRYNDPSINIDWSLKEELISLSDKDSQLNYL